MSNTALNKFLKGEIPYDPTLDKYESWVRGRREAAAAALADHTYNPAEQIIGDVAGLGGMEPEERVLEVYRRALRRRLSKGLFAELDRWRDEYLSLPD